VKSKLRGSTNELAQRFFPVALAIHKKAPGRKLDKNKINWK